MSGWTAERVEELARLWKEGKSASEVAQIMGGLTRNAVIGKVFRLGLSDKNRPRGRRPSGQPTKKEKRKAAKRNWRTVANKGARWNCIGLNGPVDVRVLTSAPLPNIVDPPGEFSLMELDVHMCKWPIGNPDESGFGFCGKGRVNGRPYCAEHVARGYIPLTKSQIMNVGRAAYFARAA